MSISYNYYETRIKELKSFLKNAQSGTTKKLINDALEISNKAISEYEVFSKEAFNQIKKLDAKQEQYDNQFALVLQETKKMTAFASNEFFTKETRTKVTIAWEAVSVEIKEKFESHTLINRTEREAISFCFDELEKTLFELIFKPNSATFKADLILDVLKKLAQKIIPHLDDIESLLDLDISRRKHQYLSLADKILIYIEQYISVVNLWLNLASQFKRKVLLI